MSRPIGTNAPSNVIVPCVPASAYTAPKVGDLVYFSTGANFEVTEALVNLNPDGQVEAVNDDASVLSVRLFGNPSLEELLYTGSPTRGYKVEGTATAGTVQADNSNGRGFIVAIDWPTTSKLVAAYNLAGAGSGA